MKLFVEPGAKINKDSKTEEAIKEKLIEPEKGVEVQVKMKLFVGARESEETALRVKAHRPVMHSCKFKNCIWRDICVEDLEKYPIKCGKNNIMKYRPCSCFSVGKSPHKIQEWMK